MPNAAQQRNIPRKLARRILCKSPCQKVNTTLASESMKIGIQRDATIKLDVQKCVELLSSLCRSFQFSELPSRDDKELGFLVYEKEAERLLKLGKHYNLDVVIFVTNREYKNNYFSYASDHDLVLSLARWQHYTTLPLENGLLFFIAKFIVYSIYKYRKHDDSTGCLNDFLWQKSGVDKCMRLGLICPVCRELLEQSISKSPGKAKIYNDLVRLLDVISNTSRWGKSVFYALEDKDLSTLTPETFEDLVADYFRALGATVVQNTNLIGFQIDALVTETTGSGAPLRTVVECKFYQDKIGNRLVNDFIRIVQTIKEAGEADRGMIVAYSGFTQDAQLVAKNSSVQLVHYKDIATRTKKTSETKIVDNKQSVTKTKRRPSHVEIASSSVFVIMPFSSDLDDLFYYGILGAIRQTNANCIRADQLHFTGDILREIYGNIEKARLIIAEVTQPNANVYYELGYANAMQKPVVLLAKDGSKPPFDIAGLNHIFYKNIADLEQKLVARLKALLGDQA